MNPACGPQGTADSSLLGPCVASARPLVAGQAHCRRPSARPLSSPWPGAPAAAEGGPRQKPQALRPASGKPGTREQGNVGLPPPTCPLKFPSQRCVPGNASCAAARRGRNGPRPPQRGPPPSSSQSTRTSPRSAPRLLASGQQAKWGDAGRSQDRLLVRRAARCAGGQHGAEVRTVPGPLQRGCVRELSAVPVRTTPTSTLGRCLGHGGAGPLSERDPPPRCGSRSSGSLHTHGPCQTPQVSSKGTSGGSETRNASARSSASPQNKGPG